jgi:membrane protein required for colicin V production
VELTQFDFVAGGLLIVSAVIGFSRGATQELFGALAFLAAAAAALFLLRFTAPLGRDIVDPDWAGIALALLFVFALTYIALRLLGAGLRRRAHETQALGLLDRGVGAGFGLVRALVVLGAFNLLFQMASDKDNAPKWVTGSVTYPVTDASGRILKAFAPEGLAMARSVAPAIEKAVDDGTSSAPKGAETGYDEGARDAMDALVEKTR